MITVVPFEPFHMKQICNEGYDSKVLDQVIAKVGIAEMKQYTMGQGAIAYTGIEDGKPVVCAGMIRIEPHLGMVWMYAGETNQRIRLCRLVKRILEDTAETLGVKRVEAKVLEQYAQGIKFVRTLGFKNETPDGMKGAGPNGETMFLYARVK